MRTKNNENKEMLEVIERIKAIVNERFFGNLSKFMQYLGYEHSTKLYRVFKLVDEGKGYPDVPIDVVMNICKCLGYSADYILFGKENKPNRTVNNIEIDNSKRSISGDRNVMGDNNDTQIDTNSNTMYLDMIKMLQEQNKALLDIIKDNQEKIKNVPLS